jgi:hypothetical protein
LKGNGKGHGVNRKEREERKERRSFFFSRRKPLPSFAFLASFAVEAFAVAFAVAVAVQSAIFNLQSAIACT